jgi:hypothetical protein
MSSRAPSSAGWMNRKPLARAAAGTTRWPFSSSSSAKSPRASRRGAAGAGSRAGRPQGAAQRAGEGGVADGFRRRAVERSHQAGRGDGVGDQAHQVVQVDPAHPVVSGPERPAQAELERRQHARQGPAVEGQDQADAQAHDAHAQVLGPQGRALPAPADRAREAVEPVGGLVQHLVAAQAVPADGRAADQHGGPAVQPGDQGDHGPGHRQAGADDPPALGGRPQAVGDRLAGQVDDGVDPRVAGDLVQVGDDADWGGQAGGGGAVAGQGGDLVSRADQGRDQAPADQARGAGDQDRPSGRNAATSGTGSLATIRRARPAAARSRRPNTTTATAARAQSTLQTP